VVENQIIAINGFTKHGWEQAVKRGVTPEVIANTVNNPIVTLRQSSGQLLMISNDAAVVMKGGNIVTTYPRALFDDAIKGVLNAAK
jgi:hypothetical protein